MIQSCGQACGVLDNKTHLLKQCFPEWGTHSPPPAPSALLHGGFLGGAFVSISMESRGSGRGLAVGAQADTGWQRPGNLTHS